ncbi:MAG: hypothetical protein ACRCV6_04530 [Formosimonas sp.]
MSSIAIIDTSVFVNLLNVPNRNQEVTTVATEYKNYVELGVTFILPMTSIIETGNHIAQNGEGGTRRDTACRFCNLVRAALEGEAPFKVSDFSQRQDILQWLNQFPDMAGQNKFAKKAEGTSFGDFLIIQEFEKTRTRHPMSEVFIWSKDTDLSNYRHLPNNPK